MTLKSTICLYLCIMLSACSFLQASETDYDPSSFFGEISNFISPPSLTVTRSNPIVLTTLAGFFTTTQLAKALDKPLYKRTHTPQFRNIIQEPAFLNSTNKEQKKNSWHFNTFFSRDYSRSYTESIDGENPKQISSYINLSDETVLGVFENIKNDPTVAAQISNFSDFSIPDLFKIFEPMKLQEHKIGFIGHYHTAWNKFTIDVKLPFLWVERNFNFTEEEKEQIYDNELLKLLGEVDEWAFAQEYFISDQLGFGTLEATFSADLIKNDAGGVQAGLTFYFPTEIAIKKSLLGTYRELSPERPQLNLEDLLNPVGGTTSGIDGWEEKVSQYFADAFLRFTTNLLHAPLGFDGHPGIAFHVAPTWHITPRLTWKSSYSIELLIAIYKNRLIMDKVIDNAEVSTAFNSKVGNSPTQVKIIEIAITDRLFPELATALVMPGAMFNSTTSFQYSKKDKTYTIGYNTFLQLREQILSHSLSQRVTWDIEAAEKPYAMQLKLFGRFNKTIQRKNHDWSFSLYLDYAIANESLGNEFLINFEIQGTF